MFRGYRTYVLGGLTGLLLFVLFLGVYKVPEGYRGVIQRGGALHAEASPGLHMKVPFYDTVTDMTVRTQKRRLEKVESYTKDIQQSTSIVSINFRLDPSAVGPVFAKYGTEYVENIVDPAVQPRFKEVFGHYDARDIVTQRGRVAAEIMESMRAELAPKGIIIEAVQIENIDFSDVYEDAAEATTKALADTLRVKQELEQQKFEVQKTVETAKAKAESTRAIAEADAYQIELRGTAEASAIAARGAALRDNPALVALIAAERWDGKLPNTMVPGSTVPFLNLTSPQ